MAKLTICFLFSQLSLCPFAAVAFAAEHLAVLFRGAPAFAPRRDVVALHKRDVELFVAERANVVLSFPDGELDVVGKGGDFLLRGL